MLLAGFGLALAGGLLAGTAGALPRRAAPSRRRAEDGRSGRAALRRQRARRKAFTKGGREVRAVDGVDLTIEPGEFVALEGPSGSGKTTLLQLLGALDRPSDGHVFFEGRDLAALRDHELAELRLRAFGFVFQQFNLIPTLTALQNVEVALAPHGVSRSGAAPSALAACSPRSASPTAPSTCRRSSPAASSSASRSRARSSSSRA